jgi:hypothetical protein
MIVTCLSAKLYTLGSSVPKHWKTKAPRGFLETEVLGDVMSLEMLKQLYPNLVNSGGGGFEVPGHGSAY